MTSKELLFLLVLCGSSVLQGQSTETTELGWKQVAGSGESGEFSDLGKMAILPGGTIAVTEPRERRIVLLSRESDESTFSIQRVGRDGEGPGEFRQVAIVGPQLGGFWALDRRLMRLTSFGEDGRIAGEVRIPLRARNANIVVTNSITYHAFAEQYFVVEMLSGPGLPIPRWIATAPGRPILRLGLDGQLRGVIAHVPTTACTIGGESSSSRAAVVIIPFCARAEVAVSRNAKWVVVVEPAKTQDRLNVRLVASFSGNEVYRVEIGTPRFRIPSAIRDSVVNLYVSRARPREAAEQLKRAGVVPGVYPALKSVLVGDNGLVWIEVESGDLAVRRYVILDSKGRELGRLSMPTDIQVRAVAGSFAAAITTLESGAQEVIQVQVDFPGSRGPS